MSWDGVIWNEALPDNNTVAHQIDDYDRDLRIGVSARMRREHAWPTAQTATNEGGHHTFVTFQAQAAAPTMAGTTAGGAYVGASSAGYPFMFVSSAGVEVPIVNSAGKMSVVSGGTQGSLVICSSANPTSIILLAASAAGTVLRSNSTTGAPAWDTIATIQEADGTTDISTIDTNFVEMTDMTLSVVVAAGDKVELSFGASINQAGGGSNTIEFQLLRDAVVISKTYIVGVTSYVVHAGMQKIDAPAAGTYTYSVQWKVGVGEQALNTAATASFFRNLKAITHRAGSIA
jgi:hypothetical protein